MDIRVGPDPEQRAASWIARRLRDAVRRRGAATLALSGGSTARPMIDALAELDVPWPFTTIWQVDERIAPDGDAARNANQLDRLERLASGVRRMPVTSSNLELAAHRYAASLPDRFDIVHLGVGDDGHTASWPPGVEPMQGSSHPVEITDVFNGWRRMTLTRPVVNGARSRVVLATGTSKRPMIERWMLSDRSLPITDVRGSRTWVFLDEAAAPRVPLH